MAHRDQQGSGASKSMTSAFNNARHNQEATSEQESNIVVGEFVSELSSAIRFRMKYGLGQGDWIEEPERFYTDGLVFGEEQAVASQVKLQITLSLDASTSMWMNNIMRYAGPTALSLDRVIRKGMEDLPQGTVHYAPFIFHEKAHKLPASYFNSYAGRLDYSRKQQGDEQAWPNYPTGEQFGRAVELGEIAPGGFRSDFKLSGTETRIAPLFQALSDWEQREGDIHATRLDIVLTDGVLESVRDVEAADRIQQDRNGKLKTVLLNFLPMADWDHFTLPGRCSQVAVTPANLDAVIRDTLSEAVSELF